MSSSTASHQNSQRLQQTSELPETFLSCYEIVNADAVRWGVRLYKVRRDSGEQTHADRSDAKQIVWSLRKKHKDLCRGYGFVVDVDEETIAVPADPWAGAATAVHVRGGLAGAQVL